MTTEILRTRELVKSFDVGGTGRRGRSLRAVDGIDLDVRQDEILGIVGESGSGKSTLGKLLMRLLGPTSGSIEYAGEDITHLDRRALRRIHREIRMVFQDPYSSLNPRRTIGDIVGEPLHLHGLARGAELQREVASLFERCGLDPGWMPRYPHELSGGQRQRVGIARALSLQPQVLIADEPVSALDVSVQASILNLILDLQAEMGFACVFISHDLGVVEFVSDRMAVMYLGEIVELGAASQVFERPRHPYTQSLLSAALAVHADTDARGRVVLEGDIPSPLNPPSGCRFHTRCPVAEQQCRTDHPELEGRGGDQHLVACHLVDHDGDGPSLTRPNKPTK